MRVKMINEMARCNRKGWGCTGHKRPPENWLQSLGLCLCKSWQVVRGLFTTLVEHMLRLWKEQNSIHSELIPGTKNIDNSAHRTCYMRSREVCSYFTGLEDTSSAGQWLIKDGCNVSTIYRQKTKVQIWNFVRATTLELSTANQTRIFRFWWPRVNAPA